MGQNLPRLWLPLPLIGLGEHKFEAIPQKIGEFQGLDWEGVNIPALAKLVECATSISLSKTRTSSPRSIKVRAVANPCRPPPIITICLSFNFKWSGQQDLNLRPPAPKAGALPGCAMPRKKTNYTFLQCICIKKPGLNRVFLKGTDYIVSFKPTEIILPLGSWCLGS